MATSISNPSNSILLVNQWTNVYSAGPVNGFSDTVRIVVEVTSGHIKLTDASGVSAITQGYGSLTDGNATSIAFEGTQEQVNTALQKLQVLSNHTGGGIPLHISAIKGGSAYNPQNGHYYEVVTEGASWKNAKTAAEGKTFNGLNGYLATITSAEENAFILSKLPSISWIGANDAATEGTWTWISGPEAGTTIYTGGDTVSGQYTNWNSGEPSNSNHDGLYENYAAFYAAGTEAGKWNDVKETDAFAYIVEYSDGFAGGTVAEQASTSIILTVPVPPVINSNGSGDNASINYAENGTGEVTTVTATDVDMGDSKTYSIAGGTDAAQFSINASTGVLTFNNSPNFEAPTNSDNNNSYLVTVKVADAAGLSDEQALTVTVTDDTGPSDPIESGGTAPVTITAPVDNAQLNLTGSGATTVDNPAGNLSVANNGSGTATVNGLNPNASLNASGTGPTQVSNPDGSLTVANNGTGAVTVMQLKPGAVLNTTGTQPVNLDLSHLVSGQTITIDNDGTGVVNLLNVPEGVIILSTGSGTGAFNYAPTLNGVPLTAQAVTAGTAADLADFTVADRDVNHSLTVTLTATNGSLSGLIDADANTAGIQLTGTASAVNTALAAAKFTATAAGAASIGISVSDGVKSATSTYHLTAAPAPQPPGPPGPPEPPKPPEPGQVDGASVTTTVTTNPEGQTVTTLVVAPVPVNRVEDGSTANPALADITLAKDSGGAALISVGLPVGVGIESETLSGGSLTLRQMLVGASQARLGEGAALSQIIQDGIDQYLPTVIDPAQIALRTLTLKAAPDAVAAGTLAQPIVITGAVGTGEASALHPHRGEALVIDARQLPAGAVLQLDNVEFAIVIGNCTVVGGSGRNFVVGDAAAQTIILGAEDDVLHGGGGNDYIGSKGGNDQLYGDAGNDTLSGGKDNDTLHGGSGNDKLYGGQGMDTAVFTGQHSQYDVTQAFGVFTVRALSGSEGTDTLVNVERIQFADQTLDIASKAEPLSWLATLYQQVLGRQADLDGFQWWAHEAESGIGEGQVLMSFILSKERIANTGQDFNTLGTADKVEYFYNTILARPSEAAGKAWWIDQIDQNGQDLVHVAEQFMHSAELTGQYLAPQDWDFLV